MDLENNIKNIVSSHIDIAIEPSKMQNSDGLDYLGINSINFMRIVIELEEMYNFEFDIEMLDFEVYANLGKLIDYVKKLIEETIIYNNRR